MHAELEITSGVIRLFEDGSKFGDPFAEVLYLVGDEGTAILKGLRTAKMDHRLWRAIRAELKRVGFTTAVWHRHKNGIIKELKYNI